MAPLSAGQNSVGGLLIVVHEPRITGEARSCGKYCKNCDAHRCAEDMLHKRRQRLAHIDFSQLYDLKWRQATAVFELGEGLVMALFRPGAMSDLSQ